MRKKSTEIALKLELFFQPNKSIKYINPWGSISHFSDYRPFST